MLDLIRAFLFFLLSLFLFISCNSADPMIDDLRWKIVYRDDGERQYEELSLFVFVSDPDGIKDLSLLRVIPMGTDLIWRVESSEWGEGGEVGWMGLPRLVMVNGDRLPDTEYSVELMDLAGRKAKRNFRPDYDRPTLDQIEWPRGEWQDGGLNLVGPYQTGSLILRHQNSQKKEVFPIKQRRTEVPPDDWKSWELWIPLDAVSRGFRLGPYSFNNEQKSALLQGTNPLLEKFLP